MALRWRNGCARNWPSLQVEINWKKRVESWTSAEWRESFTGFLGFDFRRVRSLRGVWRAHYTPKLKKADGACYASSRMCSAATNRNRLIGS